MIIATHYPALSDSQHLEEITLQLCRYILDLQKNSTINPSGEELISVDIDETAEMASFEAKIQANIVNGALIARPYFPSPEFGQGAGIYPFNRANPFDALLHVGAYHSRIEATDSNTADADFIQFNINTIDEEAYQFECVISGSNFPISVATRGGATETKARPYLL